MFNQYCGDILNLLSWTISACLSYEILLLTFLQGKSGKNKKKNKKNRNSEDLSVIGKEVIYIEPS